MIGRSLRGEFCEPSRARANQPGASDRWSSCTPWASLQGTSTPTRRRLTDRGSAASCRPQTVKPRVPDDGTKSAATAELGGVALDEFLADVNLHSLFRSPNEFFVINNRIGMLG